MSFLWPTAWMFFGLAIPIALLYLLRQRLRSKPVSSLLFWQTLETKLHNQPFWRKLRRLLSLLLQLLLLTILLLALARPILSGQRKVALSRILILDPNVTMTTKNGQQTRWTEALRQARAEINDLGFGDEMTLLLAGNPPQILCSWTGHHKDLLACLTTLQPASSVTDIRPTLRLAQNLVLSHPGATIELISDTVWSVAPDPKTLEQVHLSNLSTSVANSGLTLFSVRPIPAAPGEYQLVAKLEQNTTQEVEGELEVKKNDQLVDLLKVSVPVGTPWQKTWRGEAQEATDFSAEWRPENPELFPQDKTARTHLPAAQTIKVGLVSPKNPFLDIALSSQPLIAVSRFSPNDLAGLKGDQEDLWIFNAVSPPPGFSTTNLVLINPDQGGAWGKLLGPIEKPLVTDFEKEAPLLRFVNLEQVKLHRATEFEPAPGSLVYAGSFGKPLIFGHWDSEPRSLVMAFDLEDSDLVFRTAFPILCANILQTLRPDEANDRETVPGPVATQLKPMAATSSAAVSTPNRSVSVFGGLLTLPLWWFIALVGLLLVLLEWALYSRRITE